MGKVLKNKKIFIERKSMKKRLITKISNLKLKPFDRYGKPIPKLSWYPISYDKKKWPR